MVLPRGMSTKITLLYPKKSRDHDFPGASGVPKGGLGGSNPPPPEIPKALQNRSKL